MDVYVCWGVRVDVCVSVGVCVGVNWRLDEAGLGCGDWWWVVGDAAAVLDGEEGARGGAMTRCFPSLGGVRGPGGGAVERGRRGGSATAAAAAAVVGEAKVKRQEG